MTATTVDLEHRLDQAKQHLDRIATYVAGPGASDELVAAAHDSLASLAAVQAAQLRGERALR